MCQSLIVGSGIILPFLIRNIIISGWLLYPVPFVDLFSFDWKIPLEKVILEKDEITVWARALNDVGKLDWELSQWFPIWFEAIGRLWRKVFMVSIIGQVAAVVRCIYLIRNSRGNYYKSSMAFIYIVEFVICFTWFFTAPSIRFGGIFCLFPGGTLLGEGFSNIYREKSEQRLWNRLRNNRRICRILVAVTLALIAGRTWIAVHGREADLLYPSSYEEYPVAWEEVDGVKFYYPIDGDQTGYKCFPAMLPGGEDIFTLRSWGNIKEGFKPRK